MNDEQKKVVIRDHQMSQAVGITESTASPDQVDSLVKNLRAQGHKAHARVDESTGNVVVKKYLTD